MDNNARKNKSVCTEAGIIHVGVTTPDAIKRSEVKTSEVELNPVLRLKIISETICLSKPNHYPLRSQKSI